MKPPTITSTIVSLIAALQGAAERVKGTDPVKYATLKAYQEALVHRLTHTKKGR